MCGEKICISVVIVSVTFVLIFLSIIVQNGLLDYYILDLEDLTH